MRYLIVVCLLLVSGLSPAATRVYYEDFETAGDGWTDTWDVTNPPTIVQKVDTLCLDDSGGCLRGNLSAWTTDPIIDNVGYHFPQLRCWFNDISDETPDTAYVIINIRLDKIYWPQYIGKWTWICDDVWGTTAYHQGLHFPTAQPDGAAAQAMTFSGNGAGGGTWDDCYLAMGTNNQGTLYSGVDNYATIEHGFDGEWHKYEYLFDYVGDTFSLWIDDVQLKGIGASAEFTDGIFPLCPEFHLQSIQWMYAGSASYTASARDFRDGEAYAAYTGYAIGFQIDNVEVWDGLPDETPGGDPETPGLTIDRVGTAVTFTWEAAMFEGYTYDYYQLEVMIDNVLTTVPVKDGLTVTLTIPAAADIRATVYAITNSHGQQNKYSSEEAYDGGTP